jgi:hypothetical protein
VNRTYQNWNFKANCIIKQVEKFKAELNTGSFCDPSSLEQREIEVVNAVTAKAGIDTHFASESPNRGCGEAVHVKPFIQSAVQLKQREMATASKSRHLPKTQTSDRTG